MYRNSFFVLLVMKEYSNEAKRFYKSKKWQKTRKLYLMSVNYLCERCGKPADIVHHKTYINAGNLNDMGVLLDFDNLEALCQNCHNKEHFSDAERIIKFDARGDPIFFNAPSKSH